MSEEKIIVNSWNEWDPLKHVIVGKADGTCIPAPEPALDAKVPEDSDMRGKFGPRTRDYGIKLNKNVKKLARKSALSMKLKSKSISVIESLDFKTPKTKSFVDILSAVGLDAKKTLFVLDGLNKNVYLSARNLNKSEVVSDSEISTYKIINAQHLVIEEKAIEKIENNLV